MSESIVRSPTLAGSLSRRLFYWLPPLLWMGVIYWFSTDNFSANNTGWILDRLMRFLLPGISPQQLQFLHYALRKTGHFALYAAFALLLMRAFRAGSQVRWRFRWALYSFFIVSGYALLDELHQSFTRHRTASIYDSAIDIAGGLTALFVLWWIRMRKRRD